MSRILDRVFRREEVNGGGTCPTYLYRWVLLKLPRGVGIYLHKFVGDDWSLDYHDHPKRFISAGLRGEYTEHYPDGTSRVYRAPWLRTFPANHTHRLTGPTPEHPCWTLVLVGIATRPWGFRLRDGSWQFWKTYVGSAESKAAKSCPD